MISSNFSKLTLCAFLLANSFGQVTMAHAEITGKCTKPFLKEHKYLAAIAAFLVTVSFVVEPTKGSQELSEELFLNDTWTWCRNAFGWFGKDAKITSIDEDGVAIYKPGYQAKGLVGAVSKAYKAVLPVAALMVVIKNIEPLCQFIGIFKEEPVGKLV